MEEVKCVYITCRDIPGTLSPWLTVSCDQLLPEEDINFTTTTNDIIIKILEKLQRH